MNTMKANFKMIGLAWKGSPGWVIGTAVNAIINSPRNLIIDVLLMGTIYNFIQQGRDFSGLIPFLIALAAFYLANLTFEAITYGRLTPVGDRKIQYSINKTLCEAAGKMPLASYDDPKFYEEYIFAIQNCPDMVKEAVQNISYFIGFTLGGLISMGMIASIQPLMLVFIGLSILFSFGISSLRQKSELQYKEKLAKVQVKEQYIHRVFYMKDYAKELRSLPGLKDFLLNKFDGIEEENRAVTRGYGWKSFLLSVLTILNNQVMMYWLIMLLTISLIWWTGDISPGNLLIMTTSVATASLLIGAIVNYLPAMKKTRLYYEKLTAFMNRSEEQSQEQEEKTVLTQVESVRFDHVSFTYPGEEHPVLKDISFSLKKGEALAIVGLNGAGKSTILKLMLKFYAPDSGKIYVNGKDLARIDGPSYRKLFGCVFQDVNLYAMPVWLNIAMDGTEDREKLSRIISETGLSNQFPRPGDWDRDMTKELSPEGLVFSGGNAQKMAIARVLYQNAPVLLLDEITSAIDPETEQEIMACVARNRRDKLTVMISHKLSCVKNMDQIIVLSNGEITETGSHNQLLEKKSNYYELFRLQSEQFIRTTRQENLEKEAWL